MKLKNFRNWNKEGNDKIIRIQDKSARLVIDSKERIVEETRKVLNDGKTFRKEETDPIENHVKKVKEWRDKWKNVFEEDEGSWLLNMEAKPATIYANPKTHKDGWPLRHIISCCGTAIENVAKWLEIHLRHLAKIHPTYTEDTRHFLEKIEALNEKYAPLPPTTLLITWDIENFYPSCNTQKVIEAVKIRLEERKSKFPPTECIVEAISLVMSSNNCQFQDEHYTQINGATIGGPESASTTDIFGAIFLDEPALKEGPFQPLELIRYRDDCFDVELNKTEEEINEFTDFLNQLVPGIKFKPKIRSDDIEFLDTLVTIKDGFLITSPFSKPTDSKQYLVPSSVHKPSVVENIPKTVGMRLRRLCSDRVEGDKIFADSLDEYRAYMEARGYYSRIIQGHFAEIANMRRKDSLKKVERRNKQWMDRPIFFIKHQEPAFPDINKSIRKHLRILQYNKELKELFPKSLFITSYKRPKNLKELLCPSKLLKEKQVNTNNGNSYIRCDKGCVTCLRINPSREFRSKVTRRNFISRIEATCLTPNLIYLVTCKVCRKQGVGSTEYLPARISNYYSHIKKKKRTNKISIHFQENQNHTAEDMDIQIIDKLLTVPKDPKELTLKLKRVEGFWQAHLRTVGENGLN